MTTHNTTVFSPCRKYRYTLWRRWAEGGSYLMVIGLNPSTADETNDDPTIRRCIDFAKRWGFNALCMTNLFAWRDTLPENMKKEISPIGPDNDLHLTTIGRDAGMILAAWGKHGKHLDRGKRVALMVGHLYPRCLKKNQDGSPQHPLYVPAATQPIPFP